MFSIFNKVYTTFSSVYIENQRPEFEQAVFGAEFSDIQIRYTSVYRYAFAGWLFALRAETEAATARRVIRAKLRQKQHVQPAHAEVHRINPTDSAAQIRERLHHKLAAPAGDQADHSD